MACQLQCLPSTSSRLCVLASTRRGFARCEVRKPNLRTRNQAQPSVQNNPCSHSDDNLQLPSQSHITLLTSLVTTSLVLVGPAAGSSLVGTEVGSVALASSQATEGFVQGLLLIFFSELGDKTFFIALLLALQRPRAAVFTGTFGALAIMTGISVGLGQILHNLDELDVVRSTGVPWDDVLAVVLLVVFGVQTLRNAANAEAAVAEEKEEAAEEVAGLMSAAGAGVAASTFALVFAAEWGDKSFLATIALAAASSPLGVTFGAITGHGLATALAVLGGSFLGDRVSASTLQYGGGFLFLAFAALSAADIVHQIT